MTVDIILIGYSGGVGRNFLRLLREKQGFLSAQYGLEVSVSTVINSKGVYHKEDGFSPELLLAETGSDLRLFKSNLSRIEAVQGSRARVLIDAGPTDLETGEPGLSLMKAALKRGMHVITLDKGPLVLAYQELLRLARENQVQLKVSGAAGAALPTADIGLYSLAGARIERITGILNGTVNYILTSMHHQQGLTYREALLEARRKGIAEPDPRLDVEGLDTAAKTLILANVLMDADLSLEEIPVEGITSITPGDIRRVSGEGRVLKLVGEVVRGDRGVEAGVSLREIPQDHPLAGVSGPAKAVLFSSDTMGELLIQGGDSHPAAAAASALKDLINLTAALKTGEAAQNNNHSSRQ